MGWRERGLLCIITMGGLGFIEFEAEQNFLFGKRNFPRQQDGYQIYGKAINRPVRRSIGRFW